MGASVIQDMAGKRSSVAVILECTYYVVMIDEILAPKEHSVKFA